MGRRTSTLAGWIARHGALAAYAVVAIGAYPIAEYLAAGTGALVYAVDVFDDGSVSRLGALAPAWREHGLTLWNPLLTGGNAWFSQFALPPIAPDSLLTLLLTPFQAFFTVQLALPVVAGLGMHVFARRSLRLPPVAALVGGSVYALSLWHYPIGLAGPAVPLMLTVVDQRPRRLASATAAHAGLLVLVVHQGLLQIALLAALLQLGWIAGGLPPARRRTALGIWIGGWLLAAVISAPMLASLAVAIPDSHRAVWDIAPELSPGEALTSMARRYASTFLAAPLPGGWGLHPPYEGTWFGGVVALPLAVVGALRAAFGRRRLRFLPLLVVAVPLFDYIGLLTGPWLEEAGPIGSFQLDRVRNFVPFVVASCTAVGATVILSRGATSRRVERVALLGALAAIAVQAPAVVERLSELTTLGRSLAPEWLRWTWVAASVAGATLLVAAAWRRNGRAAAAVVLVGIVLVLGVERAAYVRVERGLVPNGTSSWEERLGDSPVFDRVRSEIAADHSRVLMTGLYPNRLLFHRIASVTGYENVYPLRMHRLLDVMLAPHLDADPAAAEYYRRWGNRAVAIEPVWARQVVDLLAARWIVTDRPLHEEGMTPVLRDGSLTLYRNEAALPRAFVVGSSRAFGSRDELLSAVAEADTATLATTAFLESDAALPTAGGTGSAVFLRDDPDRVELRVDAAQGGVLVLADAFMPGWEATVDGEAAPVLAAYAALRAVPVPAGSSTVTLTYRPTHMPPALVASLFGIGLLGALAVVGARRR